MQGHRAHYTHGHAESVLRSHRWRTAENSAAYLLPHLRPGHELLDVGCGPGTLTVDLARRVAPGAVTAIEPTDQVLDIARAEAADQGVDVRFAIADVLDLDLPDDSFDVVHTHQVLHHIGDPVRALQEMARVCRPDGLVAVRECDYAGFTWWPLLPELDEWMLLFCDAQRDNGGEPDAGRRLLSWAQAAGLRDAVSTSSTWCFATPADREYWGGMWAERIVASDLTEQLLGSGAATRDDLERISQGWRAWVEAPDGWFSLLHGEVLCRP